MNLDIDTLSAACISDKESIKVCSLSIFWKNYFKKHNLPIPEHVNYYVDWIDEFYIALEVKEKMNNLYHQALAYRLNDDIDTEELLINTDVDETLKDVIHYLQYQQLTKQKLSLKNIEILLYYGNMYKNGIFIKTWIIRYFTYDNNHIKMAEYIKSVTKEEMTKYLNNVIFLDLEEVDINNYYKYLD